jgi:hypothetical protein
LSAQFDFPNFIGLIVLLAGIGLWVLAVFAFLEVALVNFLIYTVIGFFAAILGGYLLKPHDHHR